MQAPLAAARANGNGLAADHTDCRRMNADPPWGTPNEGIRVHPPLIRVIRGKAVAVPQMHRAPGPPKEPGAQPAVRPYRAATILWETSSSLSIRLHMISHSASTSLSARA